MIMKQAKSFGEDYISDRAAEGQAARLDMDPSSFSPEAQAKYNEQMAELKLAGINADEAAAQALRATQNYEVAQRYQSLGQYQRVGFAKQHMAQKKTEWPSLLQDRMSNDNTTQITRPDGTTFTPQQAMQSGSSAERAAAASVLYKGFIKDAGMSQSNPLFVEQYFAGGEGGARQQTQKFLADANKASNINKSQQNFYNAQQEFGIDGDFGDLWRGTGTLLDEKGKPLSFDDRWKKVTATVEAAIKNGQIKDVDAFLENNVDPLTGQPISKRTGFANKVKAAYDNYRNTNYKRINDAGKRTYQDLEAQFLATAQAEAQGGLTYGEYQAMQKQLQTIQGGSGESKALAALYQQTEQVENLESNKSILMQAAADGTLTPKMVEEAGFADGSPEAVDKMNKARANQKTVSDTNNFSKSKSTIDQAIKQVANPGT